MNILAIAAHPDDVEEMVFGTLMKYRQRGDDVYIALATSGNIGSNHSASRAEIASTTRIFVTRSRVGARF